MVQRDNAFPTICTVNPYQGNLQVNVGSKRIVARIACSPMSPCQESINNCECNYRRLVDADALGNTPSDGVKPLEVRPRSVVGILD